MTQGSERAAELDKLWGDEGCVWHIDYDASYGNEWPWTVVLEWHTERDTPHDADWVTYRWLFTAEAVDVALAEAVEWCEGLLPFKRCDECDGAGEYGRVGELVTCEACNGSGLATLDTTQGSEKPPRRLWRHLPQDDEDLVLTVARVLCDWNGVAGDDREQAAYILNALYDNGYSTISSSGGKA